MSSESSGRDRDRERAGEVNLYTESTPGAELVGLRHLADACDQTDQTSQAEMMRMFTAIRTLGWAQAALSAARPVTVTSIQISDVELAFVFCELARRDYWMRAALVETVDALHLSRIDGSSDHSASQAVHRAVAIVNAVLDTERMPASTSAWDSSDTRVWDGSVDVDPDPDAEHDDGVLEEEGDFVRRRSGR